MAELWEVVEKGGVLALLFLLGFALVVGMWKASKFLAARLFEEREGIIPKWFRRHDAFLTNIEETAGALKESVGIVAVDMSELKAMHSDPKAPFSTSRTNKAIVRLADALLAQTPDEKKQEVETHVRDIKRLFE